MASGSLIQTKVRMSPHVVVKHNHFEILIMIEAFVNIVSKVVEANKLVGAVKEVVLNSSGRIPRSFLRGVKAKSGWTYALYGLSVYATARLVTRVEDIHNELYVDRGNVLGIDEHFWQLLDNPQLEDSHLRSETSIRVRSPKHLIAAIGLVVGFGALSKKLVLSVLPLILILLHKFRGHVYNVNSSHYNDLVCWAAGRERNASLLHAMRSRLYRRFYSQFAFGNTERETFLNTLSAAYMHTRQPRDFQIPWF